MILKGGTHDMKLGQTIWDIRKERKMTQEEFAQIFHVTRQTVSNWCSRSKFLTNFLKTFDKDFREIFPGFTDTKRRAEPSAFLTIILQITPTLQRRLPPHLRTLQAPLPKLQSHHG